MLLTFFQQKNCSILDVNFNESLTNDVVSFEQLGPALYCEKGEYVTADVYPDSLIVIFT